jgi:glycosyltransferase involved in cell wall biosynthesis
MSVSTLTNSAISAVGSGGSPAATEHGTTGLSVLMVDPSSFSLNYDYSLCNALVAQGCQVKLAHSEYAHEEWHRTASFHDWKYFYSRSQARRMKRSGRWFRIGKAAEHIFDMQRLAGVLKHAPPDVIHFQWLPLPALDRLSLARLSRIAPIVLTLHNTNLLHGSPDSILQVLGFRSVFQYVSAVIVHTEFSRDRVLAQGWASPEKIRVVPHGAFEHYRALLSDAPPAGAGQHRILFLGSIESYKGVDLLLDAFARLPQDLQKVSELIISGLPRKGTSLLQDRSKALGIDNRVRWNLRFITEQEVAALFSSATVAVLPYREADQSAALLTAVALGTPVIASRVGGIPETIRDGVHGRLFENGDAQGLANALEDVLTSPERRRLMQEAMLELGTGPLSWDSAARQTIAVYKDCQIGSSNRCRAIARTNR